MSEDRILKYRAYHAVIDYTGLELNTLKEESGTYYTKDGKDICDIADTAIDRSKEIPYNYKRGMKDWFRELISSISCKGWNRVKDLALEIDYSDGNLIDKYQDLCYTADDIRLNKILNSKSYITAKMLIPTLFFLVFFLSLRKRTGGYHLNSFGQCYVGTVAAYIIILGITPILVNYPKLLLGMLFPAICVIKLIGTVNHPNMHMNDEELAESNKAAGIMVVLEGFIIYFFALIRADMVYICYMSAAIILCAVLLCAAKILKQEVKKNEEN